MNEEPLELPSHAPLMTLGQTALFPNTLLPLHIFEPRYRAMLAWVLENHRMFCIAMVREWEGIPQPRPERRDRDFYDVAGIGLVRACRGREDGTSDLILQGIARIRLGEMIQDRPFPMMELDYLEPVPAEEALAAGRMQQVRALCRKMREPTAKEADQVDEHLAEIESAELLCDVVANTFIGAAHRRQQLLEELDVSRRLILLTTFLLAELGG